MRIAELWIYPVKGARGTRLAESDVLVSGLRHDRRFMIVDREGVFLSQRSHPRLALVEARLDAATSTLTIATPASPEGTILALAPAFPDHPKRSVRVWDDEVDALEVQGDASALLSEHLQTECSLVFMPDDVVRQVEIEYARPGDRVGFADGFPVLLASLASLAELNGRLADAVPMNRFRPNLVVEGGEAFEEDRFERAVVGSLAFRMPKRCARCQVTTVDQETAKVGKEPLRTLSQYRREGNKVHFAQNLIPDGEGVVRVGDEVRYVEPRAS
ncbi:Flavodoxin reductase [Labilithrix luteola]|uniref:Flavodoxin reductase n=1 Tax=Labilithrix luteola TaxID=1391654 RepID=A0A0K1Q7Z0_9BACT|nr:MOSC N-terminal beta barrel domain-containing protein [Labilithrix luteola]AKV01767.1 Flavodoxin reductase [Labilithrix luteola]